MKKLRILFVVAVLGVALLATTIFTRTPTAHAATHSPSSASTCISNAIPTTNLLGTHVYLRYQSLNYAYTAYFQATQTSSFGEGTFTVGWWIFKGNTLVSSQIVQGWNAAVSPIYYPYTGLELGAKVIYGTSPIEFYPAAYNCGGYWWPPQQVTV
ncbi:MAG TPA: hypothetical protein VEI53_12495 [Ktedonobacteraceae bacterium]|nr:hypothetical protein [Ktedonobacteraceae bacterium]